MAHAAPPLMPNGVFEACPSLRFEFTQGYPALSSEAFQKQVLAVRDRYFPAMKDLDLSVNLFSDPDDFLHAGLKISTLFKDPMHRSYRIWVNSRLLDSPPSPTALNAILTHELKHVQDYTQMAWPELVFFGAQYELFPIAGYERRTDEAPLASGQGCGLIQYRFWLYSHEAGKGLEEKVRDYYSPDEILEWMRHH